MDLGTLNSLLASKSHVNLEIINNDLIDTITYKVYLAAFKNKNGPYASSFSNPSTTL